MELYTIGHSSHPVEEFIQLLEEHGIRQLMDVRSIPYSRFHPQFNKAALTQVLVANGIAYTWAGESLGGRPKDPTCYKNHVIPAKSTEYMQEISYPDVMQRPWFVEGVHQLLDVAGQQTTCILCAEKDPASCHRHHLIAMYLLERFPEVNVWHILGDGSLVNARSVPNLNEPSDTQQLSF
jgi:uncharacterized protein (DUF488 family)